MRLPGVVAVTATLLPILLGGCSLLTRYEWHQPGATPALREADESACRQRAQAEVGRPPIAPFRHIPTKKQVRRYQSETCSKKCARRRADEAANPHYDFEEWIYDQKRSRYESEFAHALASCMAALGYERRKVLDQ